MNKDELERTTVWVFKEVQDIMRRLLKEDGLSFSEFVRTAQLEYIKKKVNDKTK